jgi:hypothetical protein
MPNIDLCEPQVINALAKAGWRVVEKPFSIRLPEHIRGGYVFADLRLVNPANNQRLIVVEVKCFPDNRSAIDELHNALGKYIAYQAALELNEITDDLYLAIPHTIDETLFNTLLVKTIIKKIHLKRLVVNMAQEVIVQWIP